MSSTTVETLRFKTDVALRRRLWTAGAFAHPAKGHIAMWQTMIERYSQPGDTVLDPMAGIGTTLVAALMGRNVVCVELEKHFVDPMRKSWAKMRTMPMLGYTMGQVVIVRGDARALPLPDASVAATITSPPYEGIAVASSQGEIAASGGIGTQWRKQGMGAHGLTGLFGIRTGYTRPQANPTAENIGNLRSTAYWQAMSICYAECWRVLRPGGILALVLKGFVRAGVYQNLPGQTEALLLAAGWQKHDEWRRELWALSFWRILQRNRDPAAFDDRLKYETVLAFRKPGTGERGVDAILTSPPFGDVNARGDADQTWREHAEESGRLPKMGSGLSRTVRYTRE